VSAGTGGGDVAATFEERAAEVAALPPDAAVPSPCINVCRIAPDSGLCAGCRRTLDEIVAWGRLDDGSKRIVWAQLARRRPA
jgi:predicted Fe-S protein YdhL (DUF1289 family)